MTGLELYTKLENLTDVKPISNLISHIQAIALQNHDKPADEIMNKIGLKKSFQKKSNLNGIAALNKADSSFLLISANILNLLKNIKDKEGRNSTMLDCDAIINLNFNNLANNITTILINDNEILSLKKRIEDIDVKQALISIVNHIF